MILGTARLGQEPLRQLLHVAAVVHFNFCFLSEEVLKVLKQLHPQLTLLIQTLELLHQLGTDLCRGGRERDKETDEFSCLLYSSNHSPGGFNSMKSQTTSYTTRLLL